MRLAKFKKTTIKFEVSASSICAFLGAIAITLVVAPSISAQEGVFADEETSFQVGGSCAALAYLDASQLKQYVSAAYSDDFHSFCYPEEPFSCSDYTSFLRGLGRMAIGDDGYHCSLQLRE